MLQQIFPPSRPFVPEGYKEIQNVGIWRKLSFFGAFAPPGVDIVLVEVFS